MVRRLQIRDLGRDRDKFNWHLDRIVNDAERYCHRLALRPVPSLLDHPMPPGYIFPVRP